MSIPMQFPLKAGASWLDGNFWRGCGHVIGPKGLFGNYLSSTPAKAPETDSPETLYARASEGEGQSLYMNV